MKIFFRLMAFCFLLTGYIFGVGYGSKPSNIHYIKEPLVLKFVSKCTYDKYLPWETWEKPYRYCEEDVDFPYQKICQGIKIDNSIFSKYQIDTPHYISINGVDTKVEEIIGYLFNYIGSSNKLKSDFIDEDSMTSFDVYEKVIDNKALIVYTKPEFGLQKATQIYIFYIDAEQSLLNLRRVKSACQKNIIIQRDNSVEKILTIVPISVLSAFLIWLLLLWLKKHVNKKYFSMHDIQEINSTPTGKDRLKIFFGLLLVLILSFPFIIGIVPFILFLLSIYFLKIDKSKAFLLKSKKYFNIFNILLHIVSIIAIPLIVIENSYKSELIENSIIGLYSYLGVYLFLIMFKCIYICMLYKPLVKYSVWIKDNHIFSRKKKGASNFIKRDNLSSFSISDELLKWHELYKKGIITKEEFEKRKEKLLSQENQQD